MLVFISPIPKGSKHVNFCKTRLYLQNWRVLPTKFGCTSNDRVNISNGTGVQVLNANFSQKMVYQSSLCHEDLILRHFVVSSTSVKRARVIKWKSVGIVLCCVQCVEIYTRQRVFADGLNFSISFEENSCWITPITSGSSI